MSSTLASRWDSNSTRRSPSALASNDRVGVMAGLVPTVYNGLAYLALLAALAVVAATDQADLRSVGAVMLVMLRSLSYGQAFQTNLTSLNTSRPYLDEIDERRSRYALPQRGTVMNQWAGWACSNSIGSTSLTRPGRPCCPRSVLHSNRARSSGWSDHPDLESPPWCSCCSGLRRPTGGSVLSDGRNIERFSAEHWARKVTFVPQHPQLVDGSIADNVRFFRDGVTDSEIAHAVRSAHLDDDIAGWSDGPAHQVGSGGSKAQAVNSNGSASQGRSWNDRMYSCSTNRRVRSTP